MSAEQLLIVLVITMLGVLVVNVLQRIMSNVNDIASAYQIERCKLHEYTYRESPQGEYLQCVVCNFTPRENN